MQELAEKLEISDEIELMELQETDQITDNGESENTTTGSRSNTQQPDEASSSSVIQISLLAQKMTKIRIPPQWTLDRKKAQTVHIQQYKMTTPPQVQLQKKEQNEYYVQELCP